MPHPFADYYNKPLPSHLEIILVDIDTTNEIKAKRKKTKTILEIITSEYRPNMAKTEVFKKRDMDGKRKLNKKTLVVQNKENDYYLNGVSSALKS